MSRSKHINMSATFIHSLESQRAFAELSGDFNSIHLDSVFARRTLFGQLVTHGVHNVLLGLEGFLIDQPYRVERLAVTFQNPVFLDEEVSVIPGKITDASARIGLRCGEIVAAEIHLQGQAGQAQAASPCPDMPDFPRQPEDKSFTQLEHDEGVIEFHGNAKAIKKAFPQSVKAMGIDGVTRLLGLTRMVGMRTPGLHSLFSGFDITFLAERSNEPTRYRVVLADDRISFLSIAVEGGGMTGSVNAFVRPTPVDQPDMATVGKLVTGSTFQGVRALVVGGSRGLGEISAKIIAAGGGDVVITYLTGKDDACQIAQDIKRADGKCTICSMDVAEPESALNELAEKGWLPTHLLYFATPRISTRKSTNADDDLMLKFRAVYVDGVNKIIEAFRRLSAEPLKIFYPSSVYVVDGPAELAEYAAAKLEGENMIRQLTKADPGLSATIERLPPLATDQTASLLRVAVQPPLDTMTSLLDKALR